MRRELLPSKSKFSQGVFWAFIWVVGRITSGRVEVVKKAKVSVEYFSFKQLIFSKYCYKLCYLNKRFDIRI